MTALLQCRRVLTLGYETEDPPNDRRRDAWAANKCPREALSGPRRLHDRWPGNAGFDCQRTSRSGLRLRICRRLLRLTPAQLRHVDRLGRILRRHADRDCPWVVPCSVCADFVRAGVDRGRIVPSRWRDFDAIAFDRQARLLVKHTNRKAAESGLESRLSS